jgi:hypothetical protein
MLGIYRVAAQLVASRVVLSSTELVIDPLKPVMMISQVQHSWQSACLMLFLSFRNKCLYFYNLTYKTKCMNPQLHLCSVMTFSVGRLEEDDVDIKSASYCALGLEDWMFSHASSCGSLLCVNTIYCISSNYNS